MQNLRAPLKRSKISELLKKEWNGIGQKSLKELSKSKKKKNSNLFLTHFDLKQEIIASDASDYRIGAVILHRFEDGTTMPVAHASRTLLPVEKNYNQIEKEGFAITFAVKIKFIDLWMEGNLFCK